MSTRIPSVKTLCLLTGENPKEKGNTVAKTLRKVLELSQTAEKGKFRELIAWATSNGGAYTSGIGAFALALPGTMTRIRMVLECANKLLDTCGVEELHEGQDNWPSYHEGPAHLIQYCNTGDTYALTLMHVKGRGWVVGSWGDIVESAERRGIRFA